MTSPRPLSDEQLAVYAREGYLRYGEVLAPGEVEDMCTALARTKGEEAAGGNDSSPEFRTGHRRGGDPEPVEKPLYDQYVNVWKRDPLFERIVRDPRLTSVAQRLLGTDRIRLWHDHIISKPPNESRHFWFHQDFYGWPLATPDLVSCWIALDDATAANGCMHVIPRSHTDQRFGLAAWQRDRERKAADPSYRSARDDVQELDASAGTAVELSAGECMFHHCLNFHATPENRTDRQRRAFIVIYMADDVRVQRDRSPTHPLAPLLSVADGQPLPGNNFPLVAGAPRTA